MAGHAFSNVDGDNKYSADGQEGYRPMGSKAVAGRQVSISSAGPPGRYRVSWNAASLHMLIVALTV
jgi:hypothetical protein